MPVDGGTAPAIAPVTPQPGRTTPLMYACSQGDLKQVQRILHEQPSTLHHLDRIRRTPLHYCAGGAVSSPATFKLPPGARLSHCADVLLMAAPDLVHSRDQDGFTPLHLAVIAGNVQLVQFLLANGADLECKDEEGHSVVHWATVCGETTALQAVLAAGAEVSSPDVHGGYPIHYAAQMCGSEKPELGLQVLHIILSCPGISVSVVDNDGRQPLLWAASAGSAKAVLALVRAGAAVESSDKDGLTALHCAASRGHTDTLDTLLTLCGAQTDVIDSNGCTALHYSVTLGHADATALLLSHSADPNLQDRKGRSPAHCGCAKGQLETVRQLHTAGANLWLRSARGDLPLHEAAASGRRQLVKWLLDQRPSQVNSRNNDGRGLLHLAALNDNADMCKILLDSGAVVNPLFRTSKNIFMTPLDCALQRGFRSTAKFLQLHGGVPASRLNTLRLTSEVTSKVSAGSQLHIREDITVFGGSSSEADIEDPKKSKDRHGRRKTVRRKLSYRHERRRSYSGSEAEIRDKCSVPEKLSKKQETERRSKSRDSAIKGKQIDTKTDKIRKKKHLETKDSMSETETPSEIRKDAKKSPTSDMGRKKSKKNGKNDSNHEITDIEKSRKITSDRDRRKGQKETKVSSSDEDQNKQTKSRSSNEELNASKQEFTKDKTKQKSDSEVKKKTKKSDISDSEIQKNKISDSETRRKESANKKDQKEESIKEKIIEETTTIQHKNEAEKLQEESKEELQSQVQKLEEKVLDTVVSKEQTDEKSTKIDEPDSGNIPESEEASKTEDTNISTVEMPKDASLPQEPMEETIEISSELVQPDQISLQSKMSEESPSKTITVEAAVHHPPKEMNKEDVQEETTNISEENKEMLEESISEETASKEITKEDEKDEKLARTQTENESESAAAKEDISDKEAPSHENEEKDATVTEPAETKTEEQTQEAVSSEKVVEVSTEERETPQSEIKSETTQETEENKEVLPLKETSTSIPVVDDSSTKEATETADQATTETEEQKTEQEKTEEQKTEKQETEEKKTEKQMIEEQKPEESKKELNIDLSLKKFEQTAEQQNEVTDIDENDKAAKNEGLDEYKQKKYRKKVKVKNGKEEDKESSSTTRETSSESESEKSVRKTKTDVSNGEHKSFKILRDDVAFEVLKDSPAKEKRVKKATKKRAKVELLNESATSSPEMLESVRRSKSVPRQKETLILPSLTEKRPESNLSAPNLSFLSDNDQKSGSNSELDEVLSSASRKKRIKRRSKIRIGSKSAGSDYESSNLIDSGFEPSPRSSRIPKRKVMSERGVNMTSVTQQIQSNIRRYHMERKIFQHLLDLKRLQIRSGQANESVLVKRAIDNYHNSVAATVGAGRYLKKDFSYRSFEQFLYESLRMLQRSPSDYLKGLPITSDNPLLCTQSTHRCLHATHAYTGIPCAAYLPKMNHHTMPKIGFTPRSSSSFLPQISSKGKSVTLELCHGNDKQVISLPADRLDHNKRYYVTFTVKGQDAHSPVDQEHTTSHRHAKSV